MVTKVCVTAADLIDSDETCIASHCLWAVVILKSLLCLSAGNSWLFNLWTRSCSRFFATDNLHLLDCSVTWSLLTLTDADWTCWLTAGSRVWKHKHKFETVARIHDRTHHTWACTGKGKCARVRARSHMLSLSCTHGRAPVFVRFQRIHRSAALFDRARGPGRPADLDAAGKAIARDCAAGRKRVAGSCGAEQANEAPMKTA